MTPSSLASEEPLDEGERALQCALGGPAPVPRRQNRAFARSVVGAVAAKKRRRRLALSLMPALAGAAALALAVVPRGPPPLEAPPTSAALERPSAEQLLEDSLEALAEEDLWLDSLDDASLLALRETLDRRRARN